VELVEHTARLRALEASAALDALTGEILRRNGVRVRAPLPATTANATLSNFP
jgi:hypothetical protein